VVGVEVVGRVSVAPFAFTLLPMHGKRLAVFAFADVEIGGGHGLSILRQKASPPIQQHRPSIH